jgi:hypothetical protein
MMTIHFPCIEAGRVRPACGGVRATLDWTTAPDKVTCQRCRTILLESAEPIESPAARLGPLPAPSGTPSLTKNAR